MNLDRLERVLIMIEQALDNKQKRHIVGGVLMSVSLLFGGLALTVMTLKMEEKKDEQY